jgi:dienelactone hydrolase
VTTKDIAYDAAGSTMIGRLAIPDGEGTRPAILIAHEGNGLDDYQKSRPARFAEPGYVAFGLDYHGGGRALQDRAAINARLTALSDSPELARAVATAGLDVLLAQPNVDPSRVAAVGYCFGGTLMLELARSGADLKAVIGMHPGLTTTRPGDSVNIMGKVLVCVGTEDPFVTQAQRLAFESEMRAAGVDWRMNLYGGAKHSFTHRRADRLSVPGIEYHQLTDERSWRAMIDLLDEVCG